MRVETAGCSLARDQTSLPKPYLVANEISTGNAAGVSNPTYFMLLARLGGRAMTKRAKKRNPKTILKLPDLEHSKNAVLNSLSSVSSRRSYDHAIRDFLDWYCSEPRLSFNRTVVTRYRIALEQRRYAPATINLRLAAVRRLAYEASDCGLLSPDLAAGIRRGKGAKRLGVRVGNWLSAEQGRKLVASPSGPELRAARNRSWPCCSAVVYAGPRL